MLAQAPGSAGRFSTRRVGPPSRVGRFFDKNVPLLKQFKDDGYRAAVFLTEPVQRVVMRARSSLQQLHRQRRPAGTEPTIGDFFAVLKDLNLLSPTLTVAKLTHVFFAANFEEEQVAQTTFTHSPDHFYTQPRPLLHAKLTHVFFAANFEEEQVGALGPPVIDQSMRPREHQKERQQHCELSAFCA